MGKMVDRPKRLSDERLEELRLLVARLPDVEETSETTSCAQRIAIAVIDLRALVMEVIEARKATLIRRLDKS